MSLYQAGPWRGQSLFSWSAGLWACCAPSSLPVVSHLWGAVEATQVQWIPSG